jgi:Flp pilus assembly protein TadD
VSLLDRQFLIPALAVTALTTTLVLLRRRWPAGLAVWIYYAIALGPVIGIVHSGHQLTNDRYSYLPGIGLAVLLGGAVGAVVHAGAAGVLRPLLAKAVVGLGVIWLGGLAYLSTQQAQVWRDTENLWRYAIEVDPDCAICHGNLGVYFAQQNQYQLAKAEFDRVLVLRPDGKKVHLQLGYLYATRGDFPRAIDHFEQYVAKYPNDVEGLNNLGVALVNARRTKEALVHLHRGLRIQPRHAQLHVSLAYAYRDLGDLPRAMSLYRDAVKLKYDMPQAWFGIARVNLESGNRDAAHKAWGLLGQLEPGLAGQIGPLFLETW